VVNVENTIDDLKDVLADAKEVEIALGQGMDDITGTDLEDSDIEMELEKLMQENAKEEKEKQVLLEELEKLHVSTELPVAVSDLEKSSSLSSKTKMTSLDSSKEKKLLLNP